MCVCVCVREREREGEVCMCVCVSDTGHEGQCVTNMYCFLSHTGEGWAHFLTAAAASGWKRKREN